MIAKPYDGGEEQTPWGKKRLGGKGKIRNELNNVIMETIRDE